MSMAVAVPAYDTVIELADEDLVGVYYYVVTVGWEWDQQRYIMKSSKPDAIKIDFVPTVQRLPRDEAFVIMDVRPL